MIVPIQPKLVRGTEGLGAYDQNAIDPRGPEQYRINQKDPTTSQAPSEANLLMALAEMHKQGRFDQPQNKMEEFKTERDKDLDERAGLADMPRDVFNDQRRLNVWRKEHGPSKGYFERPKGNQLMQDDDEVLDPTRGGTKARALKGT